MAKEIYQYQIGDFLYVPGNRSLSGPEAAYRLSAPIASLLQLLAANAGQPLARARIIEQLFANDADSAASRTLTCNIGLLRTYLGDSSQNSRYIQTIPGYGYRLTASVTETAEDGDPKVADSTRMPHAWRFLVELRKRKVCRATLLYAVSVWLVFQIADIVFSALHVPDWVLSLVVVIGVLGFPIAMILAWVFEVTPAGLVLDVPYSDRGSRKCTKRDAVWNLALLAASLLISCQMLVSAIVGIDIHADSLQRLAKAQSIVVAPFRATSVNLETKAFAFALSEQLRHLLHADLGLDVIASDALPMLGNSRIRADLFMEGSVTISSNATQVMVHLVDPNDGHYLWSDVIAVTVPLTGAQPALAREILNILPIGQQQIEEEPASMVAKALPHAN